MVLGLISARGGSIRLPRKNIKRFCGYPLVAWSIMQSLCSRLIDLTVLTTDDDEIAEVGEAFGAKIIRRPVWDNDTTVGVAFAHAVHELEKENIVSDEIVTLLPTSPIKKPCDLDNMINAFHFADSVSGGNEIEMATFAPDRETFVSRNVTDMTNLYGVPYYVNNLDRVTDKSWNYSKLCGGWGISKRDYVMNIWETQSPFDSEIDKALKTKMFAGRERTLAYAVEPWQCFETDYDHYFKLCELIMEQFVLCGAGMEVYTRYAREFRKIVPIPQELTLPQAFGNARQFAGD